MDTLFVPRLRCGYRMLRLGVAFTTPFGADPTPVMDRRTVRHECDVAMTAPARVGEYGVLVDDVSMIPVFAVCATRTQNG